MPEKHTVSNLLKNIREDLNIGACIRQSVEIELIVSFHFHWLLNINSSILPLT